MTGDRGIEHLARDTLALMRAGLLDLGDPETVEAVEDVIQLLRDNELLRVLREAREGVPA
jgi:hypothetical protein